MSTPSPAVSLLRVEWIPPMTGLTARPGSRWLEGAAAALGAAGLIVIGLASPAAADPPTVEHFSDTFSDVNPCTGEMHTVTIELAESQHFHGDNFIATGTTTITTEPTGFSGRGTATVVETEGAFVFRHVDILSDAAGNRIMASVIFVVDPATGDIRVEDGELTCVHSVD
jgi:hypothetical protein